MFSHVSPEALVPADDPLRPIRVLVNRALERLLRGEVAGKFFAAVLADPEVKPLLSSGHFSVDGTLIEAWALMKSFRPKDGSGAPRGPGRNGERDFHGEKRSNETHASTTDPDARLARKSNAQTSKLCYAGHAVIESRHGLAVAATTTRATGTAERDAGEAMMAGLDRAARSRSALGDRWADHAAPGLRGQPAHPQADRGSVRLGQGDRRHATHAAARSGAGRMELCAPRRRLQPRPIAEADGGACLTGLIGGPGAAIRDR